MTPDTSNVLVAAGLTLFAGLATGIGSAIALFARRTNFAMLAASLSFSAGVMLYVSFTEILGKADRSLAAVFGPRGGGWVTAAAFFGGILFIGLIDRFIPSGENPHQVRDVETVEHVQEHVHGDDADAPHAADRLLRMGRFAAIAIAIHNFPEGVATFMAALEDPHVGLVIAAAVALHNIPEGVSVSVPIFYATGDRRKAFTLSALSGIAEPVGGLLGYAVLRAFFTPATMGIVFGVVAGIMVFISLDELLPTAREYGEGHQVVYGLVGGMAVMCFSLLLMR